MQALQRKIDRFCQSHPRFGIPNLMICLLAAHVAVYFLDLFTRGYPSYMLGFHMGRIFDGEIWRLVTFILLPTNVSNVFFFAISVLFYYFIGSSLERHWGTAKFSLFILFGALFTLLAGIIIGLTIPGAGVTMYYVFLSMFFTIAILYPDMTILLFFIIPFKAKWVAWLNAALFLYAIIAPLPSEVPAMALLPLVALLNYFLLFGGDAMAYIGQNLQRTAQRAKTRSNTVDFKSAQQHAREKKGYLHKCAVCGRTDVTSPELEFRYCSKCAGYYCYCGEHIASHVHVE